MKPKTKIRRIKRNPAQKKFEAAVALLVVVVLFAWGIFELDKKDAPGIEAEGCPAPVTVTNEAGTTIYQAPCNTTSTANPWTMTDGYVKSIAGKLPSTTTYCSKFFVAIKEGTHHDVEIKQKTPITSVAGDLKTCQDVAVALRESLQKNNPAPQVSALPDSLETGIQQGFRESFYYQRYYPESLKIGSYTLYHDGHALHKTHWRKQKVNNLYTDADWQALWEGCAKPDTNGLTGCTWKYDANYYDYYFNFDPKNVKLGVESGLQKICRIHVDSSKNITAYEVRERPVWDQNNKVNSGQTISKCIEPTLVDLCQHQDKFPYTFDYQTGGKSKGVVHKCDDITLKFTPKGEWFQNLGIDLINPDEFVSPPTDILACTDQADCLAKAKEYDVLVGSKGKGALKTPANFVDLVQKSIASETAGLTCSGGICKTTKSGTYSLSSNIPATSYYGQCTDTGAGNIIFKLPGVNIPVITTKTSLKVENRPPTVSLKRENPNPWNSIEIGKAEKITCTGEDPDKCLPYTDKISQFDWESVDDKGKPNAKVSVSELDPVSWLSSFIKKIDVGSRSNPSSHVAQVKVSDYGKVVVGCSAWDDDENDKAHGRGFGEIILNPGKCIEDGICIPNCPTPDPDCKCTLTKTDPLYDIIRINRPVSYKVNVNLNNIDITGYRWFCDKDSSESVTHPKTTKEDAHICTTYSILHRNYEPKVEFLFKEKGVQQSAICSNGGVSIRTDDCLLDGVCNPDCPYDPDCCADEGYAKNHLGECCTDPTYKSLHPGACGTISSLICLVERVNPPMAVKTATTGSVEYKADIKNLASDQVVKKFVWYCDSTDLNTYQEDNLTRSSSFSNKKCIFNKEGTYKPLAVFFYKDSNNVEHKGVCENLTDIDINVTGVSPASCSSCVIELENTKEIGTKTDVKVNISKSVCDNDTLRNETVWTANGGNPTSKTGKTFTTSFDTAGKKIIKALVGKQSCEKEIDVKQSVNLGN